MNVNDGEGVEWNAGDVEVDSGEGPSSDFNFADGMELKKCFGTLSASDF